MTNYNQHRYNHESRNLTKGKSSTTAYRPHYSFQRDLQENPQIIVESRSHAGGTSNDEWRNGLVFSKDDELPEFYDLITKFINRQREVLEEQLQKL